MNDSFVGCIVESRFSLKLLLLKFEEAKDNEVQNSDECSHTFLTEEQNKKLQDILNYYEDIFSIPEAEIDEFPNLEVEINLSNHKPIKCKPCRVTEPDRRFMSEQVDKWIANKVCSYLNSSYWTPAFVMGQLLLTPKCVVIDYSCTINPVTIKVPFTIDQVNEIIK